MIDRTYVEQVLAESLSEPVSPDEVAELVRRLAFYEEQVARVRVLPLEEVEPWLPPSLEEER